MNIEYAKDPFYSSQDESSIDLTVKFSSIAEEIPFTAKFDDPAQHGRDLFVRAKNGEFGPIAPYKSPA